MSAAKMVADSTQSDLPDVSATKKRKKVTQKKKTKKKKESEKKNKHKGHEEEFNATDLDLDNDIRSLGYYVKDREVLLDQLFHCLQGSSLQRVVPDVLKDLPLEVMKKRCLEELEVMSRKRIQRIIAGDDPSTISSSGTDEDSSEEDQNWDDCAAEGEQMEGDGVEEEEKEYQDIMSIQSNTPVDSDSQEDVRYAEHEEGSLGHNTPIYSDEEQYDRDQNSPESVYEGGYDVEDTGADAEDAGITEQEKTKPDKVVREEPEEGEVYDDDNEDGVNHTKIAKGDGNEVKQLDNRSPRLNAAEKKNGEQEYILKDEKVEISEAGLNKDGTGTDVESSLKGAARDEEYNDDEEVEAADMAVNEAKGNEGGDVEVVVESKASQRVVCPPVAEAIAPVLTKNQMELLELQMRARAIKSMLKNSS